MKRKTNSTKSQKHSYVTRLRQVLRIAGVAFILVIIAEIAQGASLPDAAAAQFVQKLGNEALTARNLSVDARSRKVVSLIRDNIDIEAVGRFMLGPYWRNATVTQRERYLNLLQAQLVKTYERRFGGQSFRVEKVVPAGAAGGDLLVDSEIGQTNGRPPVAVEWRVHEYQGQMKITDIVVDGISMTVQRRGDFASIIERNGGNIEALLTALESN